MESMDQDFHANQQLLQSRTIKMNSRIWCERRKLYLFNRKLYRRRVLIPCFTAALIIILMSYSFIFALPNPDSQKYIPNPNALHRQLLQETPTAASGDAASGTSIVPEYCKPKGNATEGGGQFPDDIFSDYQLRHGAVTLHFIGLVYMFIALAIVCDEFFVPSLGVLTERLAISDDVAGATFMAAGGSAPEFFTSVIGVFIAQDNVGIGTIVGSATFNILCVIAFCCVFSHGVLHLTWWPLFRDVSFYILALALLVIFFLDEQIRWYEALVLFIVYILYAVFMKFNEQLEFWVKVKLLGHHPDSLIKDPEVAATNFIVNKDDMQANSPTAGETPGSPLSGSRPSSAAPSIPGMRGRRRSSASRRQSIPILHSGAMFRNGIVQLMVHTLDPLSELHVDDRLVHLQGMASVNVVLERASLQPHKAQINKGFHADSEAPVPGTPENDDLASPPHDTSRNHPNQINGTKLNSLGSLNEIQRGDVDGRGPSPTALPITATGPFSISSGYNSSASSYYGNQVPMMSTEQTNLSDSRLLLLDNETNPHQLPTSKTGPPQSNGDMLAEAPRDSKVKKPNDYANGHSVPVKKTQAETVPVKHGTQAPIAEEEDDVEEPLDISWPNTCRKQLTYLILAPIVFPLWLTLPDVRREASHRWFYITFLGSILWIAFFSYLMVWWANTIGLTLGIPTEIMGLTILAAGTSIPDLITSVLVARKGLGDMAVSSSVGSNIFDVCVGLPIPWLLYFLAYAIGGDAQGFISVVSKGLVCSVGMLFIMLLLLMFFIGLFKWKMNKIFGFVMLVTYLGFLVISVMLEVDRIACPLRLSKCAS